MSIFKNIDSKLEQISIQLKAKLTIDRPWEPEISRTFEERRLDWIDGGIYKAIIIQPLFEKNGVNQELWSLVNVAWIDFMYWKTKLIDNKEFYIIEQSIDELLATSIQNLSKIKNSDLTLSRK